ncbi:MAG: hypothetical protein IKU41_08380 [Clostridia bacterium]|nr:hypothetical protein [Clostridia bacterium]
MNERKLTKKELDFCRAFVRLRNPKESAIRAGYEILPEFRDAPAGLNFHGKGTMITPLGAKLIKSNDINSTLIGLDKNCALEMVTAGGVMTEFDKLIDRQLERAAITQISGFAKIFADASKVMNV